MADSVVEGYLSGEIGQLLRWATERLRQRGIPNPQLDAEVLLSHVLNCTRAQLHGRWAQVVDDVLAQRFASLIERRLEREPVAYLIGYRPFYDIDLLVSPAVLIPRPETEHIVEEALRWAESRPGMLSFCDVGTGSGALAVVLARSVPRAGVTAVDLSQEALDVARQNALRWGVAESIQFVQSDLLHELVGQFDIIVSNPPYIPRADLARLDRDIRDYEPALALDGGPDGLDLVRRLLCQAAQRLSTPGLLLIEIDHRQAQVAMDLAQKAMPRARVSIVHDLAGLERIVRVERCEDECVIQEKR